MVIEQNVMLQVLDMYKNMPHLWDRCHPNYSNKAIRASANRELLKVYQEYDANATIQTLNKKIYNLRTTYYNQVQRLKEPCKPGTNKHRIYERSLWYFKALKFLGDKGAGRSNLQTVSSSDDEESYENAGTPPSKMRSTVSQDISNGNGSVDEVTHVIHKEGEIIGRSIGLQLQDLDTKQLAIAQKLISDAIYYAKLGLLTENSHVSLGAEPHPS